ncbi:MAG: HAD family hydrolase [Asgard group archaeon]|nr:HAD family hydrolase [Asgard group archaeon]
MIKCVCFDFDRTLAYVKPPTHKYIPQLLTQYGHPISVEAFKKHMVDVIVRLPESLSQKMNRFGKLSKEDRLAFKETYNKTRIAMLNLDISAEELNELQEKIVKKLLQKQKKYLYDDVTDTITKLKSRDLKLYVLSGNHSDGIIQLLSEANLLDKFENIITCDKYDVQKINNFSELLSHSNFAPQEILHIGDDVHTDGHGPKQYGINSIIIRRPGQMVFNHEKHPYPVIKSLNEVFNYLS